MTLTPAERDWLDALWRQAERDAYQARWDAVRRFPHIPEPTTTQVFWPNRPPLS